MESRLIFMLGTNLYLCSLVVTGMAGAHYENGLYSAITMLVGIVMYYKVVKDVTPTD